MGGGGCGDGELTLVGRVLIFFDNLRNDIVSFISPDYRLYVGDFNKDGIDEAILYNGTKLTILYQSDRSKEENPQLREYLPK